MNTGPRLDMVHLVWPIFIENLLRTSLMSVDVFMLSMYSDKAVAAVGLANQFAMFLMLTYNIIAVGTSILIAQNLGAGKKEDAGLTAVGSFVMGMGFAILMSLALVLGAEFILSTYNLEPDVHRYAWEYMVIYGAGSIFVAFNLIQGTILRAHGHSRDPMVVNVAANVINVAGNALFILGPTIGPITFPILGVVGVAISTVFSQAAACLMTAWCIRRRKDVHIPFSRLASVPRPIFKNILAIGVPSAGENLSYNIGQIVIMSMVSTIGTAAMSAYVYTITVMRFVFASSLAIGVGTQIKVGHLVGAGLHDHAHRRVYQYFGVGFGISLVLVTIANLLKEPILGLFTADQNILPLAYAAMLVALVLEPGRNFNLVIIPALKGAGDVRFPVYMGMIFMWGIGVGLGYVLGIVAGLGLAGIWVAMASDEWIRGLIMLGRWKSGAWRNKAFVTKDPSPAKAA